MNINITVLYNVYLLESKCRIIGLPHGVINKDGHQLSDLIQIVGPGLLQNKQ